jgi:hypothetical protein
LASARLEIFHLVEEFLREKLVRFMGNFIEFSLCTAQSAALIQPPGRNDFMSHRSTRTEQLALSNLNFKY